MLLLIYGSGGTGKDILWIAKKINEIDRKWNKFLFIEKMYFLLVVGR